MRTLVLANLFLAVLLFLASCTNSPKKAESQTPSPEKKEPVTIQTVTLDIEGIT